MTIADAQSLAIGTAIRLCFYDGPAVDCTIVARTDDDRGWWLDDGSWIKDNGLECYGEVR